MLSSRLLNKNTSLFKRTGLNFKFVSMKMNSSSSVTNMYSKRELFNFMSKEQQKRKFHTFSSISRNFGRSKDAFVDHYKVLGLSQKRNSLTVKELSNKFKELSLKFHPDLNPGKDTNEQYMQIKDSYEALREKLTRKEKRGESDSDSQSKQENVRPSKDSNFRKYQRQAYNNRHSQENWDFKTEEEFIFYLVFGYNWDENMDKYLLKSNMEKRRVFKEKVINLRRNKYVQECEQNKVEVEEEKQSFGENLDSQQFILQAFQTRFSGIGSPKEEVVIQNEEMDPKLKLFLVSVILAGVGLMGYISRDNHTKKVTTFHFINF